MAMLRMSSIEVKVNLASVRPQLTSVRQRLLKIWKKSGVCSASRLQCRMKTNSEVTERLRLVVKLEVFLVLCHLLLAPKNLKVIVHQFVKRQWLREM